jgi:RNA-directed DNA polymerase
VFATRELTDAEFNYLRRLRTSGGGANHEAIDAAIGYASILMTRDLPVLFDLEHVAWVTGLPPRLLSSMALRPGSHYVEFRIAKRGGGSREIAAPRPTLKHAQRWISEQLLANLIPHQACHGFVPGRSIRTNALPHVRSELVLKLDIRDFFPTISRARVFRLFRRVGYNKPVATLLTGLTTLSDSLPQGAPSSPQLANLVSIELDARLAGLAHGRGFVYTRYADDLTFSGETVGNRNVKRLIERIIRDSGFRPNERKGRYLHPHQRQAVTGVTTNARVSWPRDRRRWLRQEIHYARKFGVESHLARRGTLRGRYKEFLYGHVYALGSVDPSAARDLLTQLDEIVWPY